jgi:hypothetical protein
MDMGHHVHEWLTVRPEIAPAWLCMLDRERDNFTRVDDDLGAEFVTTIDRLTAAIEADESFDLAARRSLAAGAHDGQSCTVAGYLLGLIRDKFILRDLGDWREFIALGSLAVDIKAATGAAITTAH